MAGMVNVRTAPPVKVPMVIVTVNTGDVPKITAVTAPPAPTAVKVRVPGANVMLFSPTGTG